MKDNELSDHSGVRYSHKTILSTVGFSKNEPTQVSKHSRSTVIRDKYSVSRVNENKDNKRTRTNKSFCQPKTNYIFKQLNDEVVNDKPSQKIRQSTNYQHNVRKISYQHNRSQSVNRSSFVRETRENMWARKNSDIDKNIEHKRPTNRLEIAF